MWAGHHVAYLSLLFVFLISFASALNPAQAPSTATDFPFSARNTICPNRCSSHGACNVNQTWDCNCFPGFTGRDCSQMVCPSSSAWVDFPTDNATAHAEFTECSNMGVCDRTTGICNCRSGFEGPACDTMICPIGELTSSIPEGTGIMGVCSGNGRCMSLRDVTRFQSFFTYFDYTYYSGWDADKIFGCMCEKGWEGVSCSKRSCPKGDDPLTTGQSPEIQILDCQCSECTGGMYITYRGQQTPLIPYDASEELLQYRFDQFTELKSVRVTIEKGDKLCSTDGSVTQIKFLRPHGPHPAITILTADGLDSHVEHDISVRTKGLYSLIDHSRYSFTGTTDNTECSSRGTCDYDTGKCRCYDGYRSSDGEGGMGMIADCGYRFQEFFNYTSNSTRVETNCPVKFDNQICSGNGTCTESTGACVCNTGYTGSDCSEFDCTDTFAWFGNVRGDHALDSVCGGVGECNKDTGVCINCGGDWGVFTGDHCEILSCPTGNNGEVCGGNGACLTMQEIGQLHYNDRKQLDPMYYSSPWDANNLRGCACSRSITVDNQYDVAYARMISDFFFNETSNKTTLYKDADLIKYYRGPYAFAATDFKGYACEEAFCPKGDNPRYKGLNEIQQLNCRADNGTFLLEFRENVTTPISWNSTAAEFQKHLEQLFTVGKVGVTLHGGEDTSDYLNGSICSFDGNRSVLIEFLTEFGDLPLLSADISGISNELVPLADLHKADESFIMNITEYQTGSKRDVECSGQGTCDESTGICKCFEGFASGNGTLGFPGELGECSFFNKFYTQKANTITRK